MQKPKDNIIEKIYLEMFSDVERERSCCQGAVKGYYERAWSG